jgi:hypothetical protein
MSQAHSKLSLTDHYARKLAVTLAKGQPPVRSPDLDQYLQSSPREIFAAFAGAACHMPPAGENEALAFGYLFLMVGLLEHLRYRTDSGHTDAAKLIAEFQAEVAAQAEAGRIDGPMLAYVGGALHQAKIPASPVLIAASEKQHVNDDKSEPLPADIRAALSGFLEACSGNPFELVGSFLEVGHALPVEARCTFAAGLALSGMPDALAAAVLFLLDPEPAVRATASETVAQAASTLSPTDLRRLIAIRNWRPKKERGKVDAIIRRARAAGVDCAQWPTGGAETMSATAIDGSGAQAVLLVSPAGRKKVVSSILTKGGIADAWSNEPETRRKIEAALAGSNLDTPMLAISRSYLDRVMAHNLALDIDAGDVPPLGLLQVAETLGGADWQPARMKLNDTLAGLIAEIPEAMLKPAAIAKVLQTSSGLAGLDPIQESWFEDDPDIARTMSSGRGRNRPKLVAYLLQSAIARHRNRWAELFLRMALWMREAPPETGLSWCELAIVAKALAEGRDMGEIRLMRDIALRTIAVHADRAHA